MRPFPISGFESVGGTPQLKLELEQLAARIEEMDRERHDPIDNSYDISEFPTDRVCPI